MAKKLALLIPIALVGAALDLYSKSWAASTLMGSMPMDIIDGCFALRYVENTGMAWGMGKGLSIAVFLAMHVVALSVLIYFVWKVPARFRLLHVSLGLITAGALGNLTDRLRLGYVVDFIDWYYKGHHWPTFNLADVYITVGVSFLLIIMLFSRQDPFQLREDNPSDKKPAA